MIIIIEGSQGSGKTHLIRSLKKSIQRHALNQDIIFYKYQHVQHMKTLDINHIEPNECFHYFTISNTLTILELQKTILKNKILVFDRGLFSAYAWSILRKRLERDTLNKELSRLLKSDIYSNCHVIRVKADSQMERDHSDIFDRYADPERENFILDDLLEENMQQITDQGRKNTYTEVFNHMDKLSEASMYQVFNKILSFKLNK